MNTALIDDSGFGQELLTDRARAALVEGSSASLRSLVEEVHPGVFVAELIRPEWCRALLGALDAHDQRCRAEGETPEPPNSMHEYGIVLESAGLDAPMQWLATTVLSPLARELFPELAPNGLIAQHAFLADYGEGRDTDLSLHVDQSEVTLDLCLTTDFKGGELVFEGRRCFGHLDYPARTDELFEYAHHFGRAVIHAGKNRHRALPIRSGRRAQLVLWGRATSEPEVPDPSSCPPWCGADSGGASSPG